MARKSHILKNRISICGVIITLFALLGLYLVFKFVFTTKVREGHPPSSKCIDNTDFNNLIGGNRPNATPCKELTGQKECNHGSGIHFHGSSPGTTETIQNRCRWVVGQAF